MAASHRSCGTPCSRRSSAAIGTPTGYTYAIASKGSPEKLTIWHNGQLVQQRLGCVELDLSDAAQAWPYLTYGSLVSVVG